MFNWLGNIFPYSDLHSLNLDWILSKMKETAAQAAKAVADAANALAQVAEAKAAALSAQTAAQNAQTAANEAATNAASAAASATAAVNTANDAQTAAQNAQNTANAAQTAAQSAQSEAQKAQTKAQSAQSAAQTAQTTAQNAQTAAEDAKTVAQGAQTTAQNAQTAAEDAQTVANNALNKFPIKTDDIKDAAVTKSKLSSTSSYSTLFSNRSIEISGTPSQMTSGIVVSGASGFIKFQPSVHCQVKMDIDSDTETTNSIFYAVSPPVLYRQKTSAGLLTFAPVYVIKIETNEMYKGFITLSITDETRDNVKCQVFFETQPQFSSNTRITIRVYGTGAQLS